MAQDEDKSEKNSGENAHHSSDSHNIFSQESLLTEEQIALSKALEEVGEENQEANKAKKKRRFLIIGVLSAVAIFFWWYLHRNEQETDDAYTTGRKVAIAPHVSGYVYELLVNDNQFVHKGDPLIRIDGRDYLTQLHNAQAQLAQAQANFEAAVLSAEVARKNFPGQLMSAQGEVADAQANLFKAQTDYARQHRVLRAATSQSDIDASTAQLESAEAKMAEAKGHLIQAQPVQARVKTSQKQVSQGEAQIKSALAALEKAQLDVGWLTVRAPCDGWISQRSIERGNFVQAGQHILSIVPKEVWIVANYKETQLTKMRVGQEVSIHVDAYPNLSLEGHVDSFQMGTGESFSTFPPENATGNFVKVVQRVPVKILIDKGLKEDLPLPLGLSVTTLVDVGYEPIDPPKVKPPKDGAGDGSFNLETMAEKAFSGKKSDQMDKKFTGTKNLDLASPSASSPFASTDQDKAMDQTLSSVEKGEDLSKPVSSIADIAEKAGKEVVPGQTLKDQGNIGKILSKAIPKDLPPPPSPPKAKTVSQAADNLPSLGDMETIKNKALAKLAELGVSKEALLDGFQETESSLESKNHDPLHLKDPNTQAALQRMAKEALEGVKTLPISPAKKAEIEKKVQDMAETNAKAWGISPESRALVKNAIKQATSGGDRKYAIDPELEKELIKAATSRDGKHPSPHTGQEAEDTVAGKANAASPPGSSIENKQNGQNYGIDSEKSNDDFHIPDLKVENGKPNETLIHDNDFDTGNVKTEGNALGGNPLGAGIR
ncbi:HlyD family secretion protein [Acetobacteraceae bacterium]|nr:HlyD family secretion protein [Acetobacteraceae bacterium]